MSDKAPVPIVLCGKSPMLAKGFMTALADTGYDGTTFPTVPLPCPALPCPSHPTASTPN